MNRRQKLVQQRFLNNEEEVIKELKKTYTTALDDIKNNIKNLNLEIDSIQGAIDVWEDFGDDEEKEILQSQLRSKIYQKQYQEALQGQIDGVLDKMNTEQFNTVSGYLKTCYDDGYIGTLYDLQGQGVPLVMPIDQESVVRAVQLDSKISQGLYNRMGEDVTGLKKVVASEVSRGVATGMTYEQVARNISHKMVGTGYKEGGAMASAMRIARTEGHRIQCQAGMDACYKAKDMGADVVKQWDSTLDGKTRSSHRQVDGEIREVEKPFSNGLMFPGDPSGKAAEVVNCRCALLQRARWALDEDELQRLKDRAEYYGLDKTENFEDFKKQYLKAADDISDVAEITDALDFQYGGFTQEQYWDWQDNYKSHNSGVHLSDEELKVIDDYTEGSFISLNAVGRYSDADLLKKGYSTDDIARIRKKADVLDGALSKYDLDTDIVTHRFERDVTWLTGNGNGVDELEKLVGKEYTAKGFTSSGMTSNRFRFTGGKSDAVHFEIVTPKGTNGAYLSMSKKGEEEFLYNRNTRFKILDGGERVVKERKYNLKTGQIDEVDVKERFLKVQVIPDKAKPLTNSSNKVTIESAKNHSDLKTALSYKNITVDNTVDSLDFESVKEGMQGIDNVLQEFPQAQPYLQKISTKDSGIMCAQYNGTINYNPNVFATRSDALAEHPTTKQYIKNNNIVASGAHEAGHVLEIALVEKDSNIVLKKLAWVDCTKAKEVVGEACKTAKKTPEGNGKLNAELKREISGYATQDASECMAEAVSDYITNGNDAAILSKEIWKILKRELG